MSKENLGQGPQGPVGPIIQKLSVRGNRNEMRSSGQRDRHFLPDISRPRHRMIDGHHKTGLWECRILSAIPMAKGIRSDLKNNRRSWKVAQHLEKTVMTGGYNRQLSQIVMACRPPARISCAVVARVSIAMLRPR